MAENKDFEARFQEEVNNHSLIMSCAQEAADILASDLKEMKVLVDRVNQVRSRVEEDKENTAKYKNALEERIQAVEESILKEFQATMSSTCPDYEESWQPDKQLVMEELQKVKRKEKEMERDLQKLENEKKILEFHKHHRNLQRKMVPVEFDMNSTEKHVKGYLQKADGKVEVFEFDFTKDSLCDAADFIWDNV